MNILAEIKADRLTKARPILHEINGQNQKLFVIYPAADVMRTIQEKHGYDPLLGLSGDAATQYSFDFVLHSLCGPDKKPIATDDESYMELREFLHRNPDLMALVGEEIKAMTPKEEEAQPDPTQSLTGDK